MRLISDDVYVFSVSRSRPGEIVACRTRSRDDVIGKNINDVLAFDKDDVKYAYGRSEIEYKRSVCLSCYPENTRRVVAIFDFMCRSSSLCLAVVFEDEAVSVARALSSIGGELALLAPLIVKLAENEVGGVLISDSETYQNIAYLYGCIAPLGELRAYHHVESAEIFRHYIDLAAELIGVEVEYIFGNDIDLCYFKHESTVFAGGFCISVIILAAMLARGSSGQARLSVMVTMGCDCAEICFGFDVKEGDALECLEFLDEIAESYGMIFRRTVNNGRAEISLVPFYCDVGLVGVKESDEYSLLSDLT